MRSHIFKIKEKVWLYASAKAAWHFVGLGKKISKEIKDGYLFIGKRGFGSVPVYATIGKTRWKTSIFPDSRRGEYILPLKSDVRKNEGIKNGDTISYSIEIIE